MSAMPAIRNCKDTKTLRIERKNKENFIYFSIYSTVRYRSRHRTKGLNNKTSSNNNSFFQLMYSEVKILEQKEEMGYLTFKPHLLYY